jgi:uncharacterized protein (UPF0261 family)
MATVVLLGTLDTKREECEYLSEQLSAAGCRSIMIDVGTYSDEAGLADITSRAVAAAAGVDLDALRRANDRGAAMDAMARGAGVIIQRIVDEGRLDGLLALGGSSGSSVAARAMQVLPIGCPKLLVSTMASGDVAPYVGQSDVTLMYSVVDIAGINSVSRLVLGNAAAGIAGMATRYAETRNERRDDSKVVAATMFGLTTPAVDEARAYLAELGYEVLVFHATGSGGRAMESLIDAGLVDGVLDLTTTELADDLVGGVLSAGPNRLEAAGRRGIPQVVSVGALDMVNFGPRAGVPERFADRQFVVHNATVTLMRTTAEEMRELGARIASKVAASTGPVEIVLPLRGVSGIDVDGGPFRDATADAACFDAIHAELDGSDVSVRDVDCAINDLGFGRDAAQTLHLMLSERGT